MCPMDTIRYTKALVCLVATMLHHFRHTARHYKVIASLALPNWPFTLQLAKQNYFFKVTCMLWQVKNKKLLKVSAV